MEWQPDHIKDLIETARHINDEWMHKVFDIVDAKNSALAVRFYSFLVDMDAALGPFEPAGDETAQVPDGGR